MSGPISERLRQQYGTEVGDWPAGRADDALSRDVPHDGLPLGGRWWDPILAVRSI